MEIGAPTNVLLLKLVPIYNRVLQADLGVEFAINPRISWTVDAMAFAHHYLFEQFCKFSSIALKFVWYFYDCP